MDTSQEPSGDDLAALLPYLRDVVFRTRGRTYWSYLSPSWETLTGYTVEESLGQHILDLVHPEDRQQNAAVRDALADGQAPASQHVKRMIRKDGRVIWVEVDVRPVYEPGSEVPAGIGTLRDVSDRIRLHATLQEERHMAHATLAALSEGVIVLDFARRIRFMNAAAQELTGVNETAVRNHPITEVIRIQGASLGAAIHDSIAHQYPRFLSGRTQLVIGDGTVADADLAITPLVENGRARGCVIVIRDVREQRQLQTQLTYQANHDLLTRLSNRAAMQDALTREHSRAMRHSTPYTLLLIDLDHFKMVNDHYGHAFGDDVLRQVANAIQHSLRESDMLARWGGEEFLALLPDTDQEEGAAVAERARLTVERLDLHCHGLRVPLTVSIGVGCNAHLQDPAESVLLRTDAALYEAKQAGRNQVWCDGKSGLDVLGMAVRVQQALQLHYLRLAFQPIFDLTTGHEVGHEALARLWSAEGRFYAAKTFIQAARRLNLLHLVDAALIPQAMAHCSALQSTRSTRLHFVNISADLLRRPEYIRRVIETALEACAHCAGTRNSDLPLVLELSAREFGDDTRKIRTALAPLLDFGMQLAIDRFSTGYASLRHLGELPVNYIKLEGDLLRNVASSASMRAVIRGIQHMADDTGARIIVEHVQDADTDALARDLGIDWAQGNFYAAAQEPQSLA
ncbi:diguanylate cyclase domain-containing protein [Acidihalobacter ferrooxydans]|uniref:GGDEF domain-containing protein n=1 Tax=Acidihalobacter ferrooxydans TaxID=1765967 RepID=A0A1P8UJN4_9GAMM|nr:diguanylate cyclase [Acidihalobacter ferrooxydans]APZ44039.1 hypothetical protein BW247_13830 [Acidihalobacter ferrooxydans]